MSIGCEGASVPLVANLGGNNGSNGANGLFGEGIWAVIILAIILGAGRNGGLFGGNDSSSMPFPYVINAGASGCSSGGMNGGVGSEVQRGFDHSSVVTKLDGITQGICDSTYALNNTITTGFSNAELSRCNQQAVLMQQLNNMAMQYQNCCCETREAIQGVNYNLATQSCDTRNTIQNTTRDIIDNANQNSRAILDALNQNYVRTLERENNDLRMTAMFANSNAVNQAARDAQTAELLRRTGNDCPTAAYVVQPPQPVTFPTGCCGTFNGGWNNSCGGCGNCG